MKFLCNVTTCSDRSQYKCSLSRFEGTKFYKTYHNYVDKTRIVIFIFKVFNLDYLSSSHFANNLLSFFKVAIYLKGGAQKKFLHLIILQIISL